MGFFDFLNIGKTASLQTSKEAFSYSNWSGANMIPFDGEKTPFELGNPKNYYLDYYTLRARSWQAYLESDIIQNAIKKYLLWIVGSGLKLQSDPIKLILDDKGINVNYTDFTNKVEAYFRLFAKTKEASYSKEENLHSLAKEALKNAVLSGDVLCVQRYDKTGGNLQLIDGYHIQTPIGGNHAAKVTKRGNVIKQGVEINKKGTHVGYFVNNGDFSYSYIPAVAKKTGRRQAWLFYGLKYKIGDVRGMSLLGAVLETASKMDRYKDATLGSAEENAKIPYTIEHNQFSDGENPMIKQLAQSMGKNKGVAPETDSFASCEPIASKIAQTTTKQTYNMPVGSTLKGHQYQTDLNFTEFLEKNMDIVFATLGIPPEVAMDKFGGAYSGSRAALKSWEYKMFTDRITLMENGFYKPFYDFWLDVFVLNNGITIEGYLKAFQKNDIMTLAAFKNCRFIGTTVPHIDPVKEVKAEREKLGGLLKNIPLTTAEQACEALNTGDYQAIVLKAEKEKQFSNDFAIQYEDLYKKEVTKKQ